MKLLGFPSKVLSTVSSESEEARIKAAYSKRHYGSRYSCFDIGNLFIVQGRERRVLDLLKRYGFSKLEMKNILEIGCGTGYWLRELIKWGAQPENIIGVDLLSDRVTEARRLCPESVRLYCGSATKLGFPDSSFDLIIQATVFTSILDFKMKRDIASQMLRLLKQDGMILWYDYYINNPRNRDVQAVKKSEICRLFPACQIELWHITLAPPVARLLAPYSWLICYLLEKIPFVCTHYLGAIRKRIG